MTKWTTRAAAFLAALAIAVPVFTLSQPVTAAMAAGAAQDSYDRELFELVNKERRAAGVAPLQWFEPARDGALSYSTTMEQNKLAGVEKFFKHDDNLVEAMKSAGCTWVGENIFYEIKRDYRTGARTPEASYAMSRYMASPGHRENILRPGYKYFVSGTVYDQAAGSLYNTQRFAGSCTAPVTAPAPTTAPAASAAVTEINLLNETTDRTYSTVRVAAPSEAVIAGDWDGTGVDVPTLRTGNLFSVPASGSGTVAPTTLAAYGRVGDEVLVGNWDDAQGIAGADKFGVRRQNIYYLKNTISGGEADIVTPYGRATDQVLVGDWNGTGTDTPVVRRGNTFYFKNEWAGGEADQVVAYGRPDDQVFAGDWDGDGKDTLVVRRGNTFYFANSIKGGEADQVVTFGHASDMVFVGDFNGSGRDSVGVARVR